MSSKFQQIHNIIAKLNNVFKFNKTKPTTRFTLETDQLFKVIYSQLLSYYSDENSEIQTYETYELPNENIQMYRQNQIQILILRVMMMITINLNLKNVIIF